MSLLWQAHYALQGIIKAATASISLAAAAMIVEGLRLLEEHVHEIGAILLDRMMPGMSGTEVVEKLQQHPHAKEIPIIIQSAMDDEQALKQGMAMGVFRYLPKPYGAGLLVQTVKKAFDQR